MLGMQFLAVVLFVVNLATYAVLIALAILRLAPGFVTRCCPISPITGVRNFFTAVAGSCLIRSQFILIAGAYGIAIVLWMASTALWIALIYGIFAALWLSNTISRAWPTASMDAGCWRWSPRNPCHTCLASSLLRNGRSPIGSSSTSSAPTLWLFGGMLYDLGDRPDILSCYTFFEVALE